MKKCIFLFLSVLLLCNLSSAAIYYIDYDNGTDGPGGGNVHDGLAEPADPGGAVYTMIDGTTTSTDSTHAVLAKDAFDNDTDDNYNGDYLYNVTRSLGVIITDYDADDTDDGSVLIHPEIVGQVATDTFYILRAIKTITEYTTTGTATGARSAGDIAYLRANITWDQGTEAVNIDFDEDGTDDDYIKIIGCDSVTNDPWADGSDVLPIVDFEDGVKYLKIAGDDYWYIERVDFRQSDYSIGMVYFTNSVGVYVKDCVIQDAHTAGVGAEIDKAVVTFDGCTFDDCRSRSIRITGGRIIVDSCIFNSGAGVGTDYGIYNEGALVYVKDSTFGVTTAFNTADIYTFRGGTTYSRNSTWNTAPTIAHGARLYSEDDDATFEAQVATMAGGIITRETTKVNGGGADSSARMAPSATCGPNNSLTLTGNPVSTGFKIWLSAAQHTVTIYANRVDSDWAAEPVAANFYIQASYLSNGATAARSLSTASAQNIADSDTWTGFTTTFTMAREGWAYISVVLAKYENGKFIYVDIKPVIS